MSSNGTHSALTLDVGNSLPATRQNSAAWNTAKNYVKCKSNEYWEQKSRFHQQDDNHAK